MRTIEKHVIGDAIFFIRSSLAPPCHKVSYRTDSRRYYAGKVALVHALLQRKKNCVSGRQQLSQG